LLIVQQGKGFYGLQLEEIAGVNIGKLETIKQFVDGNYNELLGKPEGPFRIFHKSFADYLIDDNNNGYYHIDATVMHKKVVNYYSDDANSVNEGRDWSSLEDHLLRYLTYHLYALVEGLVKSIKQQTVRNDLVVAMRTQIQAYSKIQDNTPAPIH
jgi:hypothetical protein